MIPEGASVVCSIPSEDKSKPSYYPAYHVINKHTGNETTANNSTLRNNVFMLIYLK